MKDALLPIYRAVAEGRLTQAEALIRIKALKQQARDPGLGILLATLDWTAAPPTVSEAAWAPDRIVLWGVEREVSASLKAQRFGAELVEFLPLAAATTDEAFSHATLQALDAIQSMLASGAQSVRVLLIVADALESAVASGFEAMFRTAMEENPTLIARTVRVPADINAAELQRVVREESGVDSPRGVAVRHIRMSSVLLREVTRWRVLEKGAKEALQQAPVVFKEGGCYLITGGAGGIGLQFAREIVAQTGAARIVLAGRSVLAPDAQKTLDLLGTPQHRIEYVTLDVTNAGAVDAVIARLQMEGQPPSGIVHCAGITRDGFILRKSPMEFASVLAPKVIGSVNLDRATQDLPLDFMLLCSSFAACWGIVGQVDYAAANAFMDAFAAQRNRQVAIGERHGRTLSMNWPLWRDGGMTLDSTTREQLQDHTGMRPLSTATAMWAMYRGFALPCDRLLVMEGELPAMQALLEVSESLSESQPVQVVADEVPARPLGIDDALKAKALDYISQQCSQVLKIPAARLRPQALLEQYGIDSILAMKLVTHLESIFGRLPKTLAFEYQTIAQLNDYFCSAHAERLIAILTPQTASPRSVIDRSLSPVMASPAKSRVPGKRVAPTRPAPDATKTSAQVPELLAQLAKPHANEPIAIVGLSGRYPNAWDLDEYWQNLSQGKDCIREIPADRWHWQDYYRNVAGGEQLDSGQHSSKWGGFIEGADEFDARFFSITPRDAEQIDPQERLFLQHAWMAMEDAGYTRATMQEPRGGQVGVYAGVMYGEYNRSGSLASIANRVSYVLNLHGPSMTLDTMCSSSLTAIHLGCQDLRLGRTEMALAGGVNLSIHPGKYGMLSAGQFISSDGHCQSFGEGGDGYIPGEGVGVVVLKRLSDAERDGDAIHAVIRGSALNHGGKTNGYTVPNPQAQAAVISAALKDAGVDARHISYIEAHGTGTKLGDPIEIAAISKAFREHTQDTGFCLIGSAKSNIGHCESAAGIAGLTKVILQMRHRQIVPSLHSQSLNPHIDFETTPFEVNQQLRDWQTPIIDGKQVPLVAGVSAFGAGGGNAHLVVEAYSGSHPRAVSVEAMPCVVLLSARTFSQLRQKAEDLKRFIEHSVDIDLHDLSYTLQIGREAMEERLAMCVVSKDELIGRLAEFLASNSPDDGALADNLYYAQSRRHRDSIALFAVDKDLQASVDKWFVAGKVSRLLDVWTKGLDLDWLKLHGAPLPRRMHLPVYPFAKERYWREEPVGEIGSVQPKVHTMHSLVHRNASKPGHQQYLSSFRADDPRIMGLSIQGRVGLPQGLQLEAARTALADGLVTLQPGETWALRDVRFAAPRAISASIELEINLLTPGQGLRPRLHDAAFELSDVVDGHVFCQGFAEACPDTARPMLDISALLRGASTLFADHAAVVETSRANGIESNALYQVVSVIQQSAGGLLLTLMPSESSSNAFVDCAIDPACLEAALLAAQWLHPSQEVLHLPSGFAGMRVHSAQSRPQYAWIRANEVARQDDALCVDISFCAGDGAVCIEFTALTWLPATVTLSAPITPQATALPQLEQDLPDLARAVRMPDRMFRSGIASPAAIGALLTSTATSLAKPSAIALTSLELAAVESQVVTLGKPTLSLVANGDADAQDAHLTVPASVVLCDQGSGIFALRVHAPQGRLDAALIDTLEQALAHAHTMSSLKALLIESDEHIFLQGGADQPTESLLRLLAEFPAPTMASLSGQAFGAGFRLACVCDVVVAVEDQSYGFTTSEEGPSIVGAAQMAWLAARFGEPLASLLATSEHPLSGRELQAAGWGAIVVPRERFVDAVDAFRDSLRDKSGNALRLLKGHLAREFEAALAAQAAAMVDVATVSATAVTGDATGHDAVVLNRTDDNRVYLRLTVDGSIRTDALLGQLQRSLRACRDADAVLLHSEFDGFLPADASVHGEALRDALRELSRLRAPVVAVLEKNATDAGLLLALACDAAVYSEDGEYGAINLHAHRAHLGLLDALLAQHFGAWGQLWAVTGERFSGRSLHARLPLLQVCPAGEVMDQAQQLSERLRRLPRELFGRASSFAAGLIGSERTQDSADVDTDTAVTVDEWDLASSVVRASIDAAGVVLVRLEDRAAKNMFSDALIAGLQEVFDHIRLSTAAKAVVLVGYDTYFSSGGTLDGLKAIQGGKVRFTDLDVFQLPMRCQLPVFAAMQGHGIGAGWTLGLFCDSALFSEESRYISPYMNFGFTPGAGATGILPAKLGFDLARESLFTGREITGAELARRNPQLTVLPRDRVLDAALALARSVARHARADLMAWKAARVSPHFEAWQALFAREVDMHAATLVGQADALNRIEQRFAPAQSSPVRSSVPPAAAARASNDILPTIRRLLAEELRVAETEIDERTQFVDLGLDSISSVTWIRKINDRFGLEIEATKVYTYPNLHKLAQHVGEQLPPDVKGADQRPVAIAAAPATTLSSMPVQDASASRKVLASAPPVAVHAAVDLGAVRRTLIDLLALELRTESESIDADRGFVELGLDSISGVTWVRAINQIYDTSIEATRIYTYPTVAHFARYMRDVLAQRAVDTASVSVAESVVLAPVKMSAPVQMRATDATAAQFNWPTLQSWRTGGDSTAATTVRQPIDMHATDIAVIGMAGRFPMANDLDSFWENIANGRNCISEIPSSRWSTNSYFVEGQPGLGQSNSKWMGVLEGHDHFDPLFFGLSPVEAEAMDPQQRVFLQCCWHGMENAGYTAERLSGSKCGVFVGCAYGDYNLLSREQQINALGFTGGATSILAARVSYFMNLHGPCVPIDTACSSSLVAISLACDSLITGASDIALAGGVYVMANADLFLKTAHAGMLSPDGRCYTFDQRANGFVPGEGVGVVMLKRVADAERDGDRIVGIVRGWGTNQDGRTNGITAPNAESQQRLIEDVYDRFNIDAERIELIEAHGTGTKLGDPIEIDGLKSAFLPVTDRKQYCAIGSVKTNIGHCLTAAGVSGFIKLLLALQRRKLPPSINFETPNEHLNLDDSPFYVNTTTRDWPSPEGVARHAAISSFGFSGTNAHLVVAEHVPHAVSQAVDGAGTTMPPEAGFVVPLSARTTERLLQKARDLRDFVRATPGLDLATLASNLQTHRDAMDERLSFVARDVRNVVEVLTTYLDNAGSSKPLAHGVFAGHVRQGRESVSLLSEDAAMTALVVDKCVADGNLSKLCELWVKGLNLDWRKLQGPRKLALIALPPYPFSEDAYWIVPSETAYAATPSRSSEQSGHLHPLLQEKVVDIREQGYRLTTAEQYASVDPAKQTELIHLPTYAFARMRCWIPSAEEVGAGTALLTSAPAPGRFLQNLDSIAGLLADLEEDRLSVGEVAARVKQLA